MPGWSRPSMLMPFAFPVALMMVSSRLAPISDSVLSMMTSSA